MSASISRPIDVLERAWIQPPQITKHWKLHTQATGSLGGQGVKAALQAQRYVSHQKSLRRSISKSLQPNIRHSTWLQTRR